VSLFDVFSSFTAALKAWLNNWLAIPVCSYFYMPQPAFAQLTHAAMMLSRWVRITGSSAVTLFGTGSSEVQNRRPRALGPTPALSGVPPCPDLGLARPPASSAAQVVSAQILSTLRTGVTAQPNLQINVCAILDTMAARFEAAKEEMTAAQGAEWENDTWGLAAEHLRLKKAKVEKWCEVVAIGGGGTRSTLTDVHDSIRGQDRETMNISTGPSVDGFEWLTPGYDHDDVQWESAMFDEILRDIHPGAGSNSSADWDADMPFEMGGLHAQVDM
jgi:hypothetical protein